MKYDLNGACVEACACGDGCTCAHGDSEKAQACTGVLAYHIDKGTINGVDVSGVTIAAVTEPCGNRVGPVERKIAYVSESATGPQREALIKAFSGDLGGPLADLARVFGGVRDLRPAAIAFQRKGTLPATVRIGDAVDAALAFFDGAGKKPRHRDAFNPIPQTPVLEGKSSRLHLHIPEANLDRELRDRSAFEADFKYRA